MIRFIFYHGKRLWSHAKKVEKLLTKYGGALQKFLPLNNCVSFDLSDRNIDLLAISLTLKACLYTLKHIRGENFRERLPGLFEILRQITLDEDNTRIIERLVTYIYQAGDINIREYKEYIQAIGQEEVEKIIITTYEQILREGRKEGLQEGEQKGSLKAARNALKIGLSLEKALEISGLSLEQLREAGMID